MRRHDLRELAPAWVDAILREWGGWMRGGHVGDGYPSISVAFGQGQSLKSFDDLGDEVDGWRAMVADSIIDGLINHQRIAISHVYLAAVWSSHRWAIEDVFVEAIAEFGERARKRGMI